MQQMFRSLQYRNARWFFGGLLLSNVGTWAQFTATAILLDRLTGSTTAIGVMTALQFLPMLVLGAWAGAVSDRFDRRKMAIITEGALAVQALILAVFDLTGLITVPLIYALTLLMGTVMAFDNPARRGFVTELVPDEHIANAVSLNTATMTGSRIFGPALAAVLVGPLGTGLMFALNSVTFLAIIGSLIALREDELFRSPRVPRGGKPVRDALAYVRASPVLLALFVVLIIVSTFGFNQNVVYPRVAATVWGGEQWFGWVLTAQSVGSLVGSLLTAGRHRVTFRWFAATGMLAGATLIVMGAMVNPWWALVVSIPVGMGSAGLVASVNAITQDNCPPNMRGRILALTAVAFLGSYPIGGPLTGIIGDRIGLAWAVSYGGFITVVTMVGFMWWALGRQPGVQRTEALRRTLLGSTNPVAASPSERP